MKIDYVILGSDMNPMYYDFWPVVSKIWKKVYNTTPVLGLICDEDSEFIEDEYGLIKKFKKVDGIDVGLQSQVIRLYLTNLLNGNLLISDIDMIPMSTKYFVDFVKTFDNDRFYVMSSDNQECLNNREYPMCYNLGSDKLFKDILDLGHDWSDFLKKLNNLNLGWTTDQNYLFDKINSYKELNPDNVIFLERGWSHKGANRRIDRLWWSYNEDLVKDGYYIDCHSLRPYNQHKDEINKLVSLIL
jgi:hypothetical protein